VSIMVNLSYHIWYVYLVRKPEEAWSKRHFRNRIVIRAVISNTVITLEPYSGINLIPDLILHGRKWRFYSRIRLQCEDGLRHVQKRRTP